MVITIETACLETSGLDTQAAAAGGTAQNYSKDWVPYAPIGGVGR